VTCPGKAQVTARQIHGRPEVVVATWGTLSFAAEGLRRLQLGPAPQRDLGSLAIVLLEQLDRLASFAVDRCRQNSLVLNEPTILAIERSDPPITVRLIAQLPTEFDKEVRPTRTDQRVVKFVMATHPIRVQIEALAAQRSRAPPETMEGHHQTRFPVVAA